MLRLDKICCTTFLVEASSNEPSARSSAIFPRNEIKICLLTYFKVRRADIDITKNARNFEWSVFIALKLSQELMIKAVMWNIINSVWEGFLHYLIAVVVLWFTSVNFLQGSLQVLCEVDIIRKVECLLSLNLLYHVHVSLVICVNLKTAIIYKWHEH